MNVECIDNKYPMGLTTSGTHHQAQMHSEPILRMFDPIDQRQTVSSDASSPINKNDSSGYMSEGTTSPNCNKDNEILDNMDWKMHSFPDEEVLQKSCDTESLEKKTPVVFRWPGLGETVYVSGSYDGWKEKIPLTKSESDFYTIVEVPLGTHQYKFLVDGQWHCSPKEPKVCHESGAANNVITIKSSDCDVFEALDFDSIGRSSGKRNCIPPGKWSQNIPPKTAPNSGLLQTRPPLLPPHLLDTILNKQISSHCEPNMLPEPTHVVLNHLYTRSIKDGMVVLGVTHRYRKKYITTLLYRPT